MKTDKIRLGISHGDINGIGYEVIFKALGDARMFDICTPIIYGSSKVAAYHRKTLNITNFSLNNVKSAAEAHPKRVNIINCVDDNVRVELGKETKMGGEAAYAALSSAVADLKEGKIDVLVTAPIHKKNIQSDSFNFPGHTEYLQTEFKSRESLMLLVSDVLKVGVVTGHIPIAEVPQAVTKEKILSKLKILNKTLKEDFTIRKPKIAVLGLNPHAGDNGLIGKEELETIIPAIEEAKQKDIVALGPYPADGFFGSNNLSKFDAVLAMYHDQGLIPFKTISFSSGVNFTAGLPIVRTSPDHGTAFEIAGQGLADEESFRQSVYLAVDVFKNRSSYKDLSKNPLKSYDISKMDDKLDETLPQESEEEQI
ncbi:4-hydroxythreonine-4-phosphate dehydrogenase PdxA [Plebeiibacterium marinum]|uniref:4-hydroxythreonine-4-phosphate dehydrogenase PdxA n=1 Tax=Plebeiibacterium marinum TaxID=2992111 RepID=A0AAE3MAC9_9BACT|nr:4-hydroxythreonine-4-phosphate dehydrogenase PdxA [Plebeiobacterium marinum]MCW3804045.1 4-hydroxythreonine-4-phosphate dehydrogenase PdxA [Plebeiobacterium marinum]